MRLKRACRLAACHLAINVKERDLAKVVRRPSAAMLPPARNCLTTNTGVPNRRTRRRKRLKLLSDCNIVSPGCDQDGE
jgi:hypothetical protein